MDNSHLRSVFLASNDFCTSQISKYGKLDTSTNKSDRSMILDITSNNVSNKSNKNNISNIGGSTNIFQEKNLIETSLPVKIKSLEREEYTTKLNLSIKTSKANNKPQQNLLLQITDENNLQFLQVLNLTEQEFLLLKSEQQLRIDFHNFPTKLMEFIELCLNSCNDEQINFGCNLDLTKSPDVLFQIVENNEFKSLTHLNLKFRSANDEMVKKYLSNGWKTKRSEYDVLYSKYTDLSENYELKVSQYEKLAEEVRNISEENHHAMEKQKNDYEKKINQLRESFLEKENNNMRTFENDKMGSDIKFKEREEMLMQKVEKLEYNLSK